MISEVSISGVQSFAPRLVYLMNLLAERKIVEPGRWLEAGPLATEAAVLVHHGSVEWVSEDGSERKVFQSGSCFNEQTLVGLPALSGQARATAQSEVQLLLSSTLQRAMSDFPECQHKMEQGILSEMAKKVEEKLGIPPGSPGVLQFSAAFRGVPEGFMRCALGHVVKRVYRPGEIITQKGQELKEKEGGMVFLLNGAAVTEDGEEAPRPFKGQIVGEAVAFGVTVFSHITVRAKTICLAWFLSRAALHVALRQFLGEVPYLKAIREEKQDPLETERGG